MSSDEDDTSRKGGGGGGGGSKKGKGVMGVEYRTWDKEEYEKKAQERAKREEEEADAKERRVAAPIVPGPVGLPRVPGSQRAFLQQRKGKVDLAHKLGKSQVITGATPSAQRGGYYCAVCDCELRDSVAYLDHINGKKHQKKMGFSMRVERSSVGAVKDRFKSLKRKQSEATKLSKAEEYDYGERIRALEDEEERAKRQKRQAKARRKQEAKARGLDLPPGEDGDGEGAGAQTGSEGGGGGGGGGGAGGGGAGEPDDGGGDDGGIDPQLAAMMGFGGFGSSKQR